MKCKETPTRRSVLALTASLLTFVSLSFVPTMAFSAPKIVVLGDSLSAGYQLPPGAGFPDRLQKVLTDKGIDAEIVGAGVSGDTTAGGLSRLDWSVGDDTDAVIVQLGANDALRGLPVEKAKANLDSILTKLKKRNVAVLLAGMLAPPNMGDDYGKAFNAIYGDLAAKHGVDLYPFFLDGVAADQSLNLADGIHPNEKGIDVIVERILPDVKRLVEAVEKPEGS